MLVKEIAKMRIGLNWLTIGFGGALFGHWDICGAVG